MIKFGTDGWRDIIGEDFTYENVRKVAHAHALYLLEQGAKRAVVGFDTRFQGEGFARVAAETMASTGLEVLLSSAYLPTPALSYAVKHYGAGGGVMISASHNPPGVQRLQNQGRIRWQRHAGNYQWNRTGPRDGRRRAKKQQHPRAFRHP